MKSTKIIAVAGGSGCGKSTLIQMLCEPQHHLDCLVLSLDDYYRDQAHLSKAERDLLNFDDPEAIDWPLLTSHLQRLCAGNSIDRPRYDFATHTRLPTTVRVEPRSLILLDGIFSLHDPEVRQITTLKLYVDVKMSIRLERRTRRDVAERGRTPESVHTQFHTTVAPMHRKFVAPTRKHADFVIPWRQRNERAVDMLALMLRGVQGL